MKHSGPLDMRMNPAHGQSAAAFLRAIDAARLARIFEENSDEPHAERLAAALAGKSFATTAFVSLGHSRCLAAIDRRCRGAVRAPGFSSVAHCRER